MASPPGDLARFRPLPSGREVTCGRSSGKLGTSPGIVMYAHRTRVRIGDTRRVTVNLPSDFPKGDVEVIVLPAAEVSGEEQTASRQRRLSVDDLLASRLSPPRGVGSVTLADIDNAIAEGALDRRDF